VPEEVCEEETCLQCFTKVREWQTSTYIRSLNNSHGRKCKT
jgi:hypothetical protein